MCEKYIDKIRIYLDNACTPMAECHFSDGQMLNIVWTNMEDREAILSYANGYTLIYDERANKGWI